MDNYGFILSSQWTGRKDNMVFKLGQSEAATEKMRLMHQGSLILTDNDTDQYVGPALYLDRDSASPAVDDYIGSMLMVLVELIRRDTHVQVISPNTNARGTRA